MAKLSKALGVDLSDIARLIQSKGRGGDTMLAHINPREAALLKSMGGSGSVNPDTGLPEFFDGFDFGTSTASGILDQPTQFQPSDVASLPRAYDTSAAGGGFAAPTDYLTSGYTAPSFGITPDVGTTTPTYGEFATTPTGAVPGTYAGIPPTLPTAPSALAETTPTTTEPSITDKISKYFKGDQGLERALRLGMSGATALYGGSQARRAAKEAETMRRELESQAKPYYEKGQEYIRRGQTGELLPAQQQAIEAQKAQAAQTRARAGVSADSTMAAQQEATIQRNTDLFRQQLIDYGFQLTGIGDQITQSAVKAGYAANRDVQKLASQFYTNAAYMAMGGLPQPQVARAS